jgi:hypothetical protein
MPVVCVAATLPAALWYDVCWRKTVATSRLRSRFLLSAIYQTRIVLVNSDPEVLVSNKNNTCYEGLGQKLWNCASQATYWHSDGLR